MIVLRDNSSFPHHYQHAVLALGNFDGLHVGHAAVIGETIRQAKAAGVPAGVMTFEPHPRRVFRPDLPPLRILPLREKILLLREWGVNFLRIVHFTRAFSETSAEAFVRHILHKQLHLSQVVTGEDFVFGHNRQGNAQMLHQMAGALGFAATACAPVMAEGMRCSSTRIREALTQGNMAEAATLLGRSYTLSGHVQSGDKRGTGIGFPTANLFPPSVFLPAYGVYAIKAQIRGKSVQGVANLGLRPTFGGTRVRLESHLFDWHEMIYGEKIKIALLHRLRGEQKFDSLNALKGQIAQDVKEAKYWLARHNL